MAVVLGRNRNEQICVAVERPQTQRGAGVELEDASEFRDTSEAG